MKIAIYQSNPTIGTVDRNILLANKAMDTHVDAMQNVDLLVLPEMAFTGYNFPNLDEIRPFLEPTLKGPSCAWARETAQRFNCHVSIGYPETFSASPTTDSSPRYYNASALIGPAGESLCHYRKRHLYYTDTNWAQEGDSANFTTTTITNFTGDGRPHDVTQGICMDLNPYRFLADWDDFEFASHVVKSKASLVVLNNAWLLAPPSPDAIPQIGDEGIDEPDRLTVRYWLARLEPLMRRTEEERKREILVVICNRVGKEGDAIYAGSSLVMAFKDGDIRMWGPMGKKSPGLLLVDTDGPTTHKILV